MATVRKVRKTVKRPARLADPDELEIPGPDDFNEPPSDFLEYYTLIYGTAGVGKSSLIASIPRTLLCSFEPKRRHLKVRMLEFAPRTVSEIENGAPNPWNQFVSVIKRAQDDRTIDCLGIDNIGEAYRACEVSFLLKEQLEAIPKDDYGVIRGQVNREFESVFNHLKSDASRIGAIFTAHVAEKEMELNTGTTDQLFAPACVKAVNDYLKKSMDFAFFMGYHNEHRALHCRWDKIWTKCSIGFNDVNTGKPLRAFALPDDPSLGYETLMSAYHNQAEDCSIFAQLEKEEDEAPRKKRKIRRTV